MAYTTPPTFSDAAILTATQWDTYVLDNSESFGGAWPSFSPSLLGWTLGNGTLVGAAVKCGKQVHGRVEYTVGSTDTKAGAPSFANLPATPNITNGSCVGRAGLFDTSGAVRAFRYVLWGSASNNLIVTSSADVRLSPTVPWTWATGDQMLLDFTFEVT